MKLECFKKYETKLPSSSKLPLSSSDQTWRQVHVGDVTRNGHVSLITLVQVVFVVSQHITLSDPRGMALPTLVGMDGFHATGKCTLLLCPPGK